MVSDTNSSQRSVTNFTTYSHRILHDARASGGVGQIMYKEIKKVGIAGAGTMGASMAETFARHSYNVILFDISEDALEKAMHSIRVSQRAKWTRAWLRKTNQMHA